MTGGSTRAEELREIERCVYREVLPAWGGDPPHPDRFTLDDLYGKAQDTKTLGALQLRGRPAAVAISALKVRDTVEQLTGYRARQQAADQDLARALRRHREAVGEQRQFRTYAANLRASPWVGVMSEPEAGQAVAQWMNEEAPGDALLAQLEAGVEKRAALLQGLEPEAIPHLYGPCGAGPMTHFFIELTMHGLAFTDIAEVAGELVQDSCSLSERARQHVRDRAGHAIGKRVRSHIAKIYGESWRTRIEANPVPIDLLTVTLVSAYVEHAGRVSITFRGRQADQDAAG